MTTARAAALRTLGQTKPVVQIAVIGSDAGRCSLSRHCAPGQALPFLALYWILLGIRRALGRSAPRGLLRDGSPIASSLMATLVALGFWHAHRTPPTAQLLARSTSALSEIVDDAMAGARMTPATDSVPPRVEVDPIPLTDPAARCPNQL